VRPPKERLAPGLRRLRAVRGLSQIARRMGGDRRWGTLKKLAKALKVRVGDLIE